MVDSAAPLPVVHVLAPYAAAGAGLWGKERVVESLMVAQRSSGEVMPRAIVFSPSTLAARLTQLGFHVDILESHHRRSLPRSVLALRRALDAHAPSIVHTHGYKANLVARAARAVRTPMRALVSTCHAWFDETAATRLYNELDRRTAALSDAVTVADAGMLPAFGKARCVGYVANGLPDREQATREVQQSARTSFDIPPDRFAIGYLARTNAVKGVLDVLAAAELTKDLPILWVVAGTGDLDARVAAAQGPNLKFVGFIENTERYRSALNAYVQASYVEGLSLSLLEAMRAGLPIVATRAGSTELAVRDDIEARLFASGDIAALAGAARDFANDRVRAQALGAAARVRFLEEFGIERQHGTFLAIYRDAAARRT